MTPGDVARVLAKIAAFDQRTIGESDVLAWHEAIGDLNLVDALDAVTEHHRATEQRLMPVHIRRITAERDRARARTAIASAADDAPCEHGQPGGDRLHPISRLPLCPLCRRRALPTSPGPDEA